MVQRAAWIRRIESAWESRSVIWLSGVRRVGKTFLCKSLDQVEYFDCELPRVRYRMEDPEAFLTSLRGKRAALDEIHRLPDPTELLKIGADHFPETRLIATGSATLEASDRFRDKLTGRKVEIRLTPMIAADLAAFGDRGMRHRLLHGGLPPFYLSPVLPESEFQEWIDSFWARDIQALFRLERRASFQRFLELLFVDSGTLFEASRFAGPCEISRGTVANYLAVLEAAEAVIVVPPYSSRRSTEIVSAPKVYGFDSGFVCHFKGWNELRREDAGILWEHVVLNELTAGTGRREILYWRDKRGHEVDFVLAGRRRSPVAIECKWSAARWDPRNLLIFRKWYPEGENWLVAADVTEESWRHLDSLDLRVMGLEDIAGALQERKR